MQNRRKIYKETEVTTDLLSKLIDIWVKKTFGTGFKFRPNQKESCITTLYAWLTHNKTVICSAPTGSGKSILAIIIAGVLTEYFNKTGYILISDLSLLSQYETDINKYGLSWSVLRGKQQYQCAVNGMPYVVGNCHLDGYNSYTDILTNYPDCASFCEYIVQRNKAITSKVLVCTYAFWLIVRNATLLDGQSPLYDTRDFTIADEAHNTIEIVQQQFSPNIKESDTIRYNTLIDFMQLSGKSNYELYDEFVDIRKTIEYQNDKSIIVDYIEKYISNLNKLKENIDFNILKKDDKHIQKKQKFLYLNAINWLIETIGSFSTFKNIIIDLGAEYLVKSVNKTNITFNCLNDSYLMKSKFLSKCNNILFMSATLGKPDNFAKLLSISNYQSIEIPSTFDYSKSPIFFISDYRMSFTEKDTSLPYILKMITKILLMYNDKRGIIQTGSYELSEKIYNGLLPVFGERLLMYTDSSDKQEQLDNYKFSNNLVLIGPTLIEGISLDDDLARFLIIAKVPYASLADNYTKEKIKFDKSWYNNYAAKNILQGIGRGVRNTNDWCVSFILDGCFTNILRDSKSVFSTDFLKRIQIIPPGSLLN